MSPRKKEPTHPVWRIVKIVCGVALVSVGFVGLFLPVLQGVLLILAGLAILSTESRRVRRVVVGIRRRHPGPWRSAEALRRRLAERLRAFWERWRPRTGDKG